MKKVLLILLVLCLFGCGKKEELKKIDLHLFLLEMEQRKAELANLDEKQKIAEEQLSDIKKEYETIRIHYETEEKV